MSPVPWAFDKSEPHAATQADAGPSEALSPQSVNRRTQIGRSDERVLELERHDRCELIESREVVPIHRVPRRAGVFQVVVVEMQCHSLIADQPVDFVRVIAHMEELGLSGEIGQRVRLAASVQENENVVGLHHANRVVPETGTAAVSEDNNVRAVVRYEGNKHAADSELDVVVSGPAINEIPARSDADHIVARSTEDGIAVRLSQGGNDTHIGVDHVIAAIAIDNVISQT